MSVLSEIRRLPAEIEGLSSALIVIAGRLATLIDLQRQNGPADERLEELERTRAKWEAEIEALVLKADSRYKAASNAEARSRVQLRNAEKLTDPFDDEGEAVEATVPRGHDPRVEAEEMLPLPLGVARNNKAHAQRAKWLS